MTDRDTIQMIRKDITERLRDRDNHDCIEAADEIERLRKELDTRIAMCDMCSEKIIELTNERDEARRLLKAVVDMMRYNMAPDAMHPKHVCDFIYCPEIATCMVCEDWTDAMVMCYPDDFQDEEETK